MSTKPYAYDMSKQSEVNRWFREMEGYLRTENFTMQGTDMDGRKFAYEAFLELKKKLTK